MKATLLFLTLFLFSFCLACTDSESGDSANTATDTYYDSSQGSDTTSAPDYTSYEDSSSPEDASSDSVAPEDTESDVSTGNTNVNLSGVQDFGCFRRLLEEGIVPEPDQIDAAGFFAEHHTPLPEPVCGEVICLQAMLGVAESLVNGRQATMLQIGLNSPLVADETNRPPLQLAVVVDVSGSMVSDGKMDFVKQGLTRLVNELRDGDKISLITYSNGVDVEFSLGEVTYARNELLDIIDALSPGGGTNLYGGLEAGYVELMNNYDSGMQNRLILLSDGVPTAGETSENMIIEMSRAFNSDGMGLTTIGLGTDFNYPLMRNLAEQADGNFYFLEDSSAVDEVFTQELSYFTVPVAFDVRMEVLEGADFRFRGAHGSHLWEDTDEGGLLEVPSVFLAHRESHSDVEPGDERRGGGSALLLELDPRQDDGSEPASSEVAQVRLEFREPGTNEIITETLDVVYPHAPWVYLSTGHFDNEIVTKSFVMLNLFAALQRSCELYHADQGEEAVRILRLVMAAALDFEDSANGGEGDVDIQLDVELMQQLIDVMIANGATEPGSVDYPDDPWPCD